MQANSFEPRVESGFKRRLPVACGKPFHAHNDQNHLMILAISPPQKHFLETIWKWNVDYILFRIYTNILMTKQK